jgi:hypothetical protein
VQFAAVYMQFSMLLNVRICFLSEGVSLRAMHKEFEMSDSGLQLLWSNLVEVQVLKVGRRFQSDNHVMILCLQNDAMMSGILPSRAVGQRALVCACLSFWIKFTMSRREG